MAPAPVIVPVMLKAPPAKTSSVPFLSSVPESAKVPEPALPMVAEPLVTEILRSKVAEPPVYSRTVPLLSCTCVVPANATLVLMETTPLEMTVAPVKELLPERANVPVPTLIRLPAPEIDPEELPASMVTAAELLILPPLKVCTVMLVVALTVPPLMLVIVVLAPDTLTVAVPLTSATVLLLALSVVVPPLSSAPLTVPRLVSVPPLLMMRLATLRLERLSTPELMVIRFVPKAERLPATSVPALSSVPPL